VSKAAIQTIGHRPITKLPRAGQRVTLLMKDGTRLDDCIATQVTVVWSGESGIVIYHKRKAVDLREVAGWWPIRKAPTR